MTRKKSELIDKAHEMNRVLGKADQLFNEYETNIKKLQKNEKRLKDKIRERDRILWVIVTVLILTNLCWFYVSMSR